MLNPETNRRVPKLRPESEWIVTEQPELRIIPQKFLLLAERKPELERAHRQLAKGRE